MQKADYWYRQSAVIPYLYENGILKLVLITSLKRKKWIVPKGIVEQGMTEVASAQKEAFEEAGVIGTANDTLLGSYQQEKWDGICTINVYAMNVTDVLDDWPEKAVRERSIVPFQKAVTLVEPSDLKQIVESFPGKIGISDY